MFNVNEIVKGNRCGTFIIIALRTIGGEQYAQVKEFNPATQRTGRGEFALPLSALRKA